MDKACPKCNATIGYEAAYVTGSIKPLTEAVCCLCGYRAYLGKFRKDTILVNMKDCPKELAFFTEKAKENGVSLEEEVLTSLLVYAEVVAEAGVAQG